MKYLSALSLLVLSNIAFATETAEKEKHQDDPTKVITVIGLGYTDDLSVSGSLALDATRKINARTNLDASEWRLGGSWLFDLGILNFSFSRSEYDDGGYKQNYSVGTFVPLHVLGVDTGKWMIFPMAGFNHNTGETLPKGNSQFESSTQFEDYSPLSDNVIMVPNSSNGGYLGAMVLRPISEHWTVLAFGGGGAGSGGYNNAWIGTGLSYKLNTHHSFNVFGFVSDDDFGRISKLGLNYSYEFK